MTKVLGRLSFLLLLAAPTTHAVTTRSEGSIADTSAAQGREFSFDYSRDPSKLILFVHVVGQDTGISHSMTLFGDGRLEAESRDSTLRVERSRIRQLDESEMVALLTEAVEAGLAEWDDDRIESLKLRHSGGAIAIVEGGTTVRMTIKLERFRRGERLEPSLEKRLVVRSPHSMAERFPEIAEFRGVNRFVGYIFAALDGLLGSPP